MPTSLDQKTRDQLQRYLLEVRTLPNELAKRTRFAVLLGELFPGTSVAVEYSRGVEKMIRITSAAGEKRGRADSYYGNAIIEFEKSLAATLGEAEQQLREYVAGEWQKSPGPLRSLLAIASDGVVWRLYRPVARAGERITPETVTLEPLRDFKVTEDTLDQFWLWLTSFLFRAQQIEPSVERIQLDFGTWSPLYRDGLAALKRAWRKVSDSNEAKTAFDTWQRYLTVTYGTLTESATARRDLETGEEISDLENFFLRHTYLATFARLMVWAALSGGKTTGSLRDVARDVLGGDYFRSKRLANLVEDDFFHWVRSTEAEAILAPAWERILSHLTEYDLTYVREDILKGVYQQLIDPVDRHDLGEYYTPDWLCERIIEQVLPETPGFFPVLDPTCGSGSFLRAAIDHYLRKNPQGTDNDRLRAVLNSVVGIDIHPVAVTIARATYVLALGKLVGAARKPIQIPVYLADSLFLPTEVETTLFSRLIGIEITYGLRSDRRRVVMPSMLVQAPEIFDEAIAASAGAAEEHARTNADTRESLEKVLAQVVPDLSKMLQYQEIVDALWDFTKGLAELIRERKDSIWSFVIRNSYRPAMLVEKFAFIVGNPPWLSYRFVADPEYQDEIRQRAIGRYRIAPKSQKLMTQMELATVFLAHSMGTFAATGAKLGFVMPRSVLNGDQHQNLILRKYNVETSKFRITSYWDLKGVSPVFNIPACVLFACRDDTAGSPSDPVPAIEWTGKLPSRDIRWQVAKPHLSEARKSANVIYLGSRAALSTEAGAAKAGTASKYLKSFRQGATIVPRSFYFVRVRDAEGGIDPDSQYWIETDPEQAKEAKRPYKDVRLQGTVEGKFIFATAVSRHLLPFALRTTVPVVLPLERTESGLEVREAGYLTGQGFREVGKWMKKAEALWKTKRGAKASKQTVYEWLNYQGKLTGQGPLRRHLVVYNHSGMNVCAAYVDRAAIALPFIVDVKLYWAAFDTRSEADYLAAILNSNSVNAAIKPFQSLGLLGQRDIHKKLLELPIPTFDGKNPVHRKLASLGAQARVEALDAIGEPDFSSSATIARQRGFLRRKLDATSKTIDLIVAKLLAGV